MRVFLAFLRVFSYIFEVILCLMGLLLCVFGLALKLPLHIGWLPWSPDHLLGWVFGLSLIGLAAVGLAATEKTRALLILFSVVVVYVLLRGIFLNTQYAFSGPADAKNALLLVMGAVVAFAGSLSGTDRRR